LSTVVGYDFDDQDWDAVSAGLLNTDAESSRWYEHLLGGEALHVRVANDPGTAVVMVEARLPIEVVDRAKLAIQIAQSYRLVSRA
jgi:hypothetical protein